MNKLLNKKHIIIVVLVSLSISSFFFSCKKELEERPFSFYSSNTFFQNAEEAKMAVMGIYEILGQYDTYGRSMSMVYSTDTDISQIDGTANVSGNRRQVGHYAFGPSHVWFEATWELLYQAVDRANLVIQRIPEMPLFNDGSEDQKKELNRLWGEALFLRGFIYFDLIRLWGDVPFKLEPTKADDDLFLAKTDRGMIYDQIFQDMETAIPLLPWNSEKSLDERISQGAAKGIYARIALFRGGFSLRQNSKKMERPENYLDYYKIAIRQTKEIMESGEHSLNPDYENIFRNYCSFILEPRESMFEIGFFNVKGDAGNNTVNGTWNSPLTDASNPHGRANSFWKTHPLFYQSFEPGDIRKDVAVAPFQIDANNNEIPLTGNKDNLWAPGKWRKTWQNTVPKDPNNTDINWVILRYADVLLMRAEAENEVNNGPDAEAYEAINEVRRRAGLDDLPSGLNKEDFFEKVVDERAHELCFEGWRKYDLTRWNMLGDKLRETKVKLEAYRSNFPFVGPDNFVDNKNELYPIPQREIDQNPNLIQNPNY